MNPIDQLGVVAQLAASIIGFTVVVAALRDSNLRDWSPLDRFRLSLLLTTSIYSLIFSLLAMLLLAADVRERLAWSIISGLAAAVLLVLGAAGIRVFLNRSRGPIEGGAGARALFFSLGSTQIVTLVLLVWNAASGGRFWPFLAVLVMALAASVLQFVRLLFISTPPKAP